MNRIALLFSLLLGLVACCPAQPPDLSGAWTPVELHWAPSEDFGIAARTKVLYFVADGSFGIINGTISQEGQETLEVTADWQTVLTGHWKRTDQRMVVAYTLSWAWVMPTGPKKEHQEVLSITKKGTLLYAGVEYRREPRLDTSALKDITSCVPAFAGGQNRQGELAQPDPPRAR
jgi:hypothetical protein